jgi:hypothetical protein
MVLVILLGVLSVLFFLCISNLAISSTQIKSAVHKSSNLIQEQSESAPLHRFGFVKLFQEVIKAIGTVLGEDHLGGRSPNRLQSP